MMSWMMDMLQVKKKKAIEKDTKIAKRISRRNDDIMKGN